MADIFTVTAPLSIRLPNGEKKIIAACYPHPKGILYFQIFWDLIETQHGIEQAAELIEGSIKGEGPWKIGQYVINVLGCHGSEPELATQFAQWQIHFEQQGYQLSSKGMLEEKARQLGALIDRE